MSFSNAFRRTTISLTSESPVSPNATLNNQQSFDRSIKFRFYFDIKEENIDSKGNITFISVSR